MRTIKTGVRTKVKCEQCVLNDTERLRRGSTTNHKRQQDTRLGNFANYADEE